MPFILNKETLRLAKLGPGSASSQASAAPGLVGRPSTPWPATTEPAAFAASALAILNNELAAFSSSVSLIPSGEGADGRASGRGLCAARAYEAGQVVVTESAFAWALDPLQARNDVELLASTIASPTLSLGGALSRFLAMHPNERLFQRVLASTGPSAASGTGAQQWASDVPSGTGITLATLSMVCPAIHKSGFQTKLPVPTPVADRPGPHPMPGLPTGGYPVQLLCLVASLTNHTCDPNIAYEPTWVADPLTGAMLPGLLFRCTRAIDVGQELCHSYVDPTASVTDRQIRLQQAYGFVCTCSKCTEELRVVSAAAEEDE